MFLGYIVLQLFCIYNFAREICFVIIIIIIIIIMLLEILKLLNIS
jgi:hypothetical protein